MNSSFVCVVRNSITQLHVWLFVAAFLNASAILADDCPCPYPRPVAPPIITDESWDEAKKVKVSIPSRSAVLSREFAINKALMLPTPTVQELQGAPYISAIRQKLVALPQSPTEAQALSIFPALEEEAIHVVFQPWFILPSVHPAWMFKEGNQMVVLAATIIHASLDDIRRAERDYPAYALALKSEYVEMLPVEGSYKQGTHDGCGFTEIDYFGRTRSRLGCIGTKDIILRVRESCVEGRLVVNYYSDPDNSDFYWCAGRDTYYPLVTRSGAESYLVVTEFGFDVKLCPDGFDDIAGQERKNLRYMKESAEKRAEQRRR